MKKIFSFALIAGSFSGCTSRPVAKTNEHRGNPSEAVAYSTFVSQRAEQLQQMGGPFKNQAEAQQQAQREANAQFGGSSADSVTTTWSSSKEANKVQAQEEFTDKVDDMAKQKKGL
jgi:hypothetical protein